MFKVNKKYTTECNTAPRICLKVAEDYVLLDAQDIPHSRPINVDKVHWSCWIEYKKPMKAKSVFLPVMLWNKSKNKEPFIAYDYSRSTREEVQESYDKYFSETYKLLDIIEVSWQEKV